VRTVGRQVAPDDLAALRRHRRLGLLEVPPCEEAELEHR